METLLNELSDPSIIITIVLASISYSGMIYFCAVAVRQRKELRRLRKQVNPSENSTML